MTRLLKWMTVIFCLHIIYLPAYAINPDDNGIARALNYSLEPTKIKLSNIQSQFANNNLELEKYYKAIEQLEEIEQKADVCISLASTEIKEISSQMKQYFGTDTKLTEAAVDATYLQDQKKELEKKLSECRLFKIKVKEAIDKFEANILKLQQEVAFTRGQNILQQISQLPQSWQALQAPSIVKQPILSLTRTAVLFTSLLIIAFLVTIALRRLIHKKTRHTYAYFIVNSFLIFIILSFGSAYLIKPNPFSNAEDNIVLQNIIVEGLFFFTSLFLFNFLFLLRRLPKLLNWYGFSTRFMRKLVLTIISLYFFNTIGPLSLTLWGANNNLFLFYENSILIISVIAMIYFSWNFYVHHKSLFRKFKHKQLIFYLILLMAATILLLDFVGFTVLAINMFQLIFALLFVSALGSLVMVGINKFYRLISYHPSYHTKLKLRFGYSGEPPYLELVLLKYLSNIAIIISLFYLFAKLIDEVSYFVNYFLDFFMYGFQLGNFKIMPLQWVSGIFILCLFILLSRYIATSISRSQQYEEEEEEKQVAIAAIMLYAGISISFFIGLLVAGFSFTNLAIIAGALSVGIGLGLQSIVNNFFSGLILLIEKPIKAGDRIKIGEVEGFVKKVRVRSTQILTPTQEDIIIPNSDLITQQVTNFMFSDSSWRVKVRVGVAYGTDTDLVNELLLQVAKEHSQVHQKGKKQPMVLFQEFGDSALIFEVWCLIKDVNRKFYIASDLHFAIDKIFKEHNITIAFPQRDVHVKFDSTPPPWDKKGNHE